MYIPAQQNNKLCSIPLFRNNARVTGVLLVCAFLRHGLGQFPDGPLGNRTPRFLLVSAECAHAPLPAARGAQSGSGAAPSLGGDSGRLPAVQQGLVAGKLVQQWVSVDSSTVVSVEHWNI